MGNRSVVLTATGTVDAGSGELYSVGLGGGADAATAVVRTGGSGGTTICKLGVGAGLSAQRTFAGSIAYSDLHVTITGTAPVFDAEI